MALKKPSEYFKKDTASVDDSVQEIVSNPGMNSFSEAYDSFRNNLSKIDSLSKSLDEYNDNVDKVNYLSEKVSEIQTELKSYLSKEELDRSLVSQLFVVEQSIREVQSKVKSINEKHLAEVKSDVSIVTEAVNNFLDVDVPKYKNLVVESELRTYNRYEELEGNVNKTFEVIGEFVDSKYEELSENLQGINQKNLEEVLNDIKLLDESFKKLKEEDIQEYKKLVLQSEKIVEERVEDELQSFSKKTNQKFKKFNSDIKKFEESVQSKIDTIGTSLKEFVEVESPKYNKLLIENKLKTEEEVKSIQKNLEEKVSEFVLEIERIKTDSETTNNFVTEKVDQFKDLLLLTREELWSKTDAVHETAENFSEKVIDCVSQISVFKEEFELNQKIQRELGQNIQKDLNEEYQKLDTFKNDISEKVTGLSNDISEKVTGLSAEIIRNESHIRVQNKHLEHIKEEVKESISKLTFLNEQGEQQNYELGKKVKYIEEVIEKFNEETLLAEGLLDNPTENNSDPLTPTGQKLVTFDDLQNHYRTFVNRIQQQLSTLGGGGETRLKYLDDIVGIATNAAAYDQKFLAYDASIQKFEFKNVPEPSVNLAEENIIYVAKDGDDANDGTLGRPKLTIKAAVQSLVAAGRSDNVVKVAPGTYIEDNPITLPDEMTVMGHSLRETTVIPQNDDKDLFYVGNGNYVAEMSYRGSMPGKAIFAFDPVDQRYIRQSPYIQNCTNFIPDSIGMRIDGKDAIGPLKSMVLDSYTQYNQGGIGVSITNEAYAQLVSLFTICDEIAVFAASGGACDLTNSNSSFGDFGLVADGVSGLKYTGIVTVAASDQADTFVVDLSVPTLNVVAGFATIHQTEYNNVTGRIKVVTDQPHKFNVGMAVTLAGLGFTCDFEPGIREYPSGVNGYVFNVETVAPGRYLDAVDRIIANKDEIQDKSLAAIALEHPDFIFPGDPSDDARYRYYDSYRLTQKNRREIIDKSLASIAVGFPSNFYFPDEEETTQQSRFYDASGLINRNKQEIVDKSLASIAVGFVSDFYFPDEDETNSQSRFYDASSLITRNKQEIVDKSLASIAVGFPSNFYFPDEDETTSQSRFYDASGLINRNRQEIVDKSLAAIALDHEDFVFPGDEAVGGGNTTPQSRFYDSYRLIQKNRAYIVDEAWDDLAATYPDFAYTETKCKRDIGFFIDAVSTDVFTGGNNYSKSFVLQYFDGNGDPITGGIGVTERVPSVYAFGQAQDYMKSAITNTLAGAPYQDLTVTEDPAIGSNQDPNSCQNVQDTIDTLVGIVTVSIGAGDTTSLPTTNIGYFDISAGQGAITGIGTTIAPGGLRCARDIAFLSEAVATDIFTGGNKYSREFTTLYFDSAGNPIQNGLVGEEAESITAFTALADYSKRALTNQLNVKNLGISSGPAEFGGVGIAITVFPSGNPGACIDVQNAVDTLVGIVTTVVAAGSTASLSTFDENLGISTTNKCARDLGFLVEAVATDIFTGGNKYAREFSVQYFDSAGNAINDGLLGEEAESIYAFNTLKTYAKKALTNQLNVKNLGISSGPAEYAGAGTSIAVLPSGNPNSCIDVQDAVDTLVGIVTVVIGAGNTSSLSGFNENLGISTTNKCARDLGFLVEAVATDIFTGGNVYSRDFTKQYFDAVTGLPINNGLLGEEAQSVYSFNTLGEYSKKAVTNQLNVKNLGISSGPAEYNGGGGDIAVLPSGNPNSCIDVQNSIDTLVAITTTVIGVGTTAFLSTFNENLGISTTNKCARDLGFLVDAVSTDLFTGGNRYSRDFTLQYFNNVGAAITNGLLGEEEESVYAFNTLGEYTKKAVTNQLNYKEVGISSGPPTYVGGGTSVPVLPSGNPDSCIDVQNSIDTLVGIVTTVVGAGDISSLTLSPENTGNFTDVGSVCRRDIGYIIDAVTEDLIGFTNQSVILATKNYFTYDGVLDDSIETEIDETITAFEAARDYMKLALNNQLNSKDLTIQAGIASIGHGGEVIPIEPSGSPTACADVRYTVDTLVGIITTNLGNGDLSALPQVSLASTIFTVDVGVATQPHYYNSGGTVKTNVVRPFDGQSLYFNDLYFDVKTLTITDGGSGYTEPPIIEIEAPDTPWGIRAQAVATLTDGVVTGIDMVSNGRGYRIAPKVTISAGINTAVAKAVLSPEYYTIQKSTEITNGISIITINENVPYEVGVGTEVKFYKQSRILATGHSFEFIGAGTDIATCLPFSGGIPPKPENETDARNGGLVVYSSTNQAGNFKIGDGVIINQNTGSISGQAYSKSLLATVTPYILSLGGF